MIAMYVDNFLLSLDVIEAVKLVKKSLSGCFETKTLVVDLANED